MTDIKFKYSDVNCHICEYSLLAAKLTRDNTPRVSLEVPAGIVFNYNIYPVFNKKYAKLHYSLLLGASACVELSQFEEAITWCEKGLAVSFIAQSYNEKY